MVVDSGLLLNQALGLPTFTVDGMVLLRRLTMIVQDGSIQHVLYPVFPPARAAADALAALRR